MPARARFTEALDGLFPTWIYMEQLIERGVKVLVYVGDVDWICNWVRCFGISGLLLYCSPLERGGTVGAEIGRAHV